MINKIFLFLILLFVSLKADIINEYQNNEFSKICNFENVNTIKNEKLLSIVGISCVKTDNLYLLPYIIAKLKHTKLARQNAIYLNTIYMQKRLLYSHFFDNLSMKGFELPNTDYIISIVFNKIKNKEYKKEGNITIINVKNKILKVYKQQNKLIIDEYINKLLLKRHWYI